MWESIQVAIIGISIHLPIHPPSIHPPAPHVFMKATQDCVGLGRNTRKSREESRELIQRTVAPSALGMGCGCKRSVG